MKPILFASTSTDFSTNGIGRLDPISCVVQEEINGEYELQLKIKADSEFADQINYRSIICAPPAPNKEIQPFRVYRMGKKINGDIVAYAHHISYDLSDIIVMPFDEEGATEAGTYTLAYILQMIKSRSSTSNPFTFWTDITATFKFEMSTPVSARSILGSIQESVGGEYEWDVYEVKYHGHRGSDRGVTIRYGKNLTNFEQDENCSEVYTGIYPYYFDNSANYVEIDGCILSASGTYDYTKILPVDLTDYFTELDEGETPSSDTELAYGEIPTKAQLLAVAKQYLKDNSIGLPEVSTTINFVQLSNSEEYKDIAMLETVNIGDTVSVYFPKMNVSVTAEVVSTEYDVLAEKYNELTLGDVLESYMSDQTESIKQAQQSVKKLENRAASNLAAAIVNFNSDISNLQTQLDGNITSWFYGHEPALSNLPASDWSTDADKSDHLGDLFYNKVTGYAYRFVLLDDAYTWERIGDSSIITALAHAQTAQDTADAKRRVFYTTPEPPYDRGDLWVQGGPVSETVWTSQNGDVTFAPSDSSGKTYVPGTIALSEPTSPSDGDVLLRVPDWDNTWTSNSVLEVYSSTSGRWNIVSLNYCLISATGIGASFTAGDTVEIRGAYTGKQWTNINGQHIVYNTGADWLQIAIAPSGDYFCGTTKYSYTSKTAEWTSIDGAYILDDTWSDAITVAKITQATDGEIIRCDVAKASGESFALSDWVKASKYTDDTRANEVAASLLTTKTELQLAQEEAAKKITGNLGGYVVFHDGDGDGMPDEILIMDTPYISTATHVWRWNQNGLAHASSYADLANLNVAITMDGQIVADYITTGTLNANLLKAGTINAVDIDGVNITGCNVKGGSVHVGNDESYLEFTKYGQTIMGGTSYSLDDGSTMERAGTGFTGYIYYKYESLSGDTSGIKLWFVQGICKSESYGYD